MDAKRRLAQLSFLFAAACAVATLVSVAFLPDATTMGQSIVIATGAALSLCVFAFAVTLALRKPGARRLGFAAVAVGFAAAALFGLLAVVVPASSTIFWISSAVTVSYSVFAAYRLVHWPAEALARPKSKRAVFISYRRGDSKETVGRIHDHLRQDFYEDRLFLDVARQVGGDDFRESIRRALKQADVVLAVIGMRWLTVTDDKGRRRIDDPDDLVRLEIEYALESDVRVIPVLVQGAAMPPPEDLPQSLRPLSYRMALPVRPDPDFKSDMQRLVEELREDRPGAATGHDPAALELSTRRPL